MESLIPVTLDDQGRKVTSGLWFDPYTGLTFIDPGDIDIDHLVRTKQVTGVEQVSHTAAEQTTDGMTPGDPDPPPTGSDSAQNAGFSIFTPKNPNMLAFSVRMFARCD